ncbi:hypothetical protein BurJ1DRAFT_4879 [Burkholderiales bacterium JOSHI_001]|nr:hypothetical protein BurJ1DRAFT_4879 [Burkholderiales bacterium JOSHI_001]
MHRLTGLLVTAGLALWAAAPTEANAASNNGLNCNIDVTYRHTNAGTVFSTQTYSRAFAVADGAPFSEDFSTPTRFKSFSASAATLRGATVVTADFVDDVGVFSTVSFTTQVTVLSDVATNSGSLGYATSLGVAGSHDTFYALSCARR